MNPVRSSARAKGASPVDLGGATSYGMKYIIILIVVFLPALFQLIVGGVLDMGGLWLYYLAATAMLVYLKQVKA